jgi:peptidylprolyl isomerase
MEKEITTTSGLKYTINKKGTGNKANAGDTVIVHYTGRLTNGNVFDSSVNREQPFSFKLGVGQVIKGWDEGVSLLNIGDKATFTIPSELAYGEQGAGGVIGPNETLVFEVELLEIQEPLKPFNVEGKEELMTESGLKIIKINESEGEFPSEGQIVSVHYSGFLTDGSLFDSSVERAAPFSFPLGQGRVIKGWDEGIALLKIGEKAQLIIPHQLGYGEQGHPPVIPAAATLIFDVELLSVQ